MQLRTKIISLAVACCAGAIVLGQWLFNLPWLNGALAWLALPISVAVCWFGTARLTRDLADGLLALEIGLLNFKDNDFSVSIPIAGDSQIKALAQLFNESAATLRKERQYIYQRELLLDKVIQSSPNVMLLLDDQRRVIYANDAARHLFHQGAKIEGLMLDALLSSASPELSEAFASAEDILFSMGQEAETWHLSRGQFLLNNQRHNLVLLKQMTRELNRQEVAVWKKVIRIVSHELNNSVAPIASMVNSGRMLTRDMNSEKLKLIFDTIEDRTAHLSQFIDNYARFAKLPLPRPTHIDWAKLADQLAQHYSFTLNAPLPAEAGLFDLVQLEQVLLNLLKNAHESGSAIEAIELTIGMAFRAGVKGFNLHVDDRGGGMSPAVLDQALLPFYSTKQSGTGLGLPLCREIVEAHGGHISLQNRDKGGLRVSIWLPQASAGL